jgi:ankyrin repeat protein
LSKGNNNRTPLHIAAEEGKVEILEKLLEWAKELQLEP